MSLKATSINEAGQPSYWSQKEVSELNQVVQQWANNTLRKLKSRTPGTLSQTMRTANRYNYGMISAAGFQFRRYGIFYQLGLFGGLKLAEARAKGKLQEPNPWYSEVMREDVPKLAKKINERFADMIDFRDATTLTPTKS